MGRRGGQKRTPALDGTNLWRDPRTGVYVWRRKHKLTGKRFRRSTGTKILQIAMGQAQKFEEECGLAVKKERIAAYERLAKQAIELIEKQFSTIRMKNASDAKALLSEVQARLRTPRLPPKEGPLSCRVLPHWFS